MALSPFDCGSRGAARCANAASSTLSYTDTAESCLNPINPRSPLPVRVATLAWVAPSDITLGPRCFRNVGTGQVACIIAVPFVWRCVDGECGKCWTSECGKCWTSACGKCLCCTCVCTCPVSANQWPTPNRDWRRPWSTCDNRCLPWAKNLFQSTAGSPVSGPGMPRSRRPTYTTRKATGVARGLRRYEQQFRQTASGDDEGRGEERKGEESERGTIACTATTTVHRQTASGDDEGRGEERKGEESERGTIACTATTTVHLPARRAAVSRPQFSSSNSSQLEDVEIPRLPRTAFFLLWCHVLFSLRNEGDNITRCLAKAEAPQRSAGTTRYRGRKISGSIISFYLRSHAA